MRYAETIRVGRLRLALVAGLTVMLAAAMSAAVAQPPGGGAGRAGDPGAASPRPGGAGAGIRGGGPGGPPPGGALRPGGGHPPPVYRSYPRGDRHHHHSSSVLFFGPSLGWGWGYPYDGHYWGGYYGYPYGYPYGAYPPRGGYYGRRYYETRESEAVTPVPPVEVFVYPQRGQGEEQQATDRYQCHRWGVDQTGFDPVKPLGGVAEADWAAKRDAYQRALAACLSARGYAVR